MKAHGQSLVEFCACVSLLIGFTIPAFALLIPQWNRVRCDFLVFTAVHARVVGAEVPEIASTVKLQPNEKGIEGELQCGQLTQRFELYNLQTYR